MKYIITLLATLFVIIALYALTKLIGFEAALIGIVAVLTVKTVITDLKTENKSKPTTIQVTPLGGTLCPKCNRDGGLFHYDNPPDEPYYLCENCFKITTDSEYAELMKPKELKEKDLNIYDLWESPNGNLFLKVTDEYSLALGAKGDHAPSKACNDLHHTQYVKSNDVFPVKMVGRLIFSDDQ